MAEEINQSGLRRHLLAYRRRQLKMKTRAMAWARRKSNGRKRVVAHRDGGGHMGENGAGDISLGGGMTVMPHQIIGESVRHHGGTA